MVQFRPDGTLECRYINLAAGNRFGKTLVLAVLHLFFAVYKHGLNAKSNDEWTIFPYSIINVCPLVDLANVLRDEILAILENRSKAQLTNPNGRGECLLTALFDRNQDGGLLVTFGDYKGFRTRVTNVTLEYRTTDDNARALQGVPRNLITFDEAGRQKGFLQLMGAHVVPRVLDVSGSILTATTPDVDTPTDLEEWFKRGDPDNFFRDPNYISVYGDTRENPHISPEQINEMKVAVPEYLWEQVLGGKFIQSSEAFFSKEDLDKCFKSDLPVSEQREDGHFYVIGADLAVAKAGDRSIFVVWDCTKQPFRVVRMVEPPKGTDHIRLIEIMKELLEFYNGEWVAGNQKRKCEALLAYDSTGLGGKMFKTELASLNPRPRGYDFGGMTKKKLEILSSLRLFLSKGLEIPGSLGALRQELKDYRRTDAKLETDRVMAMALAAHLAERSLPVEVDTDNWTTIY